MSVCTSYAGLRLIAFKWDVCLSDFACPGNAFLFSALGDLRLHTEFCLKGCCLRWSTEDQSAAEVLWLVAKLLLQSRVMGTDCLEIARCSRQDTAM